MRQSRLRALEIEDIMATKNILVRRVNDLEAAVSRLFTGVAPPAKKKRRKAKKAKVVRKAKKATKRVHKAVRKTARKAKRAA
jgi:hypothetical protein